MGCAHVIRSNDGVMLVINVGPDSKDAIAFVEKRMEEMALWHFEQSAPGLLQRLHLGSLTYEGYRRRMGWNWVTVPSEVAP